MTAEASCWVIATAGGTLLIGRRPRPKRGPGPCARGDPPDGAQCPHGHQQGKPAPDRLEPEAPSSERHDADRRGRSTAHDERAVAEVARAVEQPVDAEGEGVERLRGYNERPDFGGGGERGGSVGPERASAAAVAKPAAAPSSSDWRTTCRAPICSRCARQVARRGCAAMAMASANKEVANHSCRQTWWAAPAATPSDPAATVE
eukprot:scaffold130349_cov63-Phaeocystis_antarctica.AAC.3